MQQRFGFIALFGVFILSCGAPAQAGWWPFQSKAQSAPRQVTEKKSLLQQPAPDYAFHLWDAAAPAQSPADWRGKTVFINFFASWCVPCRAEHPVLTKLHSTVPATPLIGVGHMDRVEDTQKMLASLGNPYMLVLEDKLGRGGKIWGVHGVPESFILNPEGLVIWNHRGPVTEKILTDEIMPLLTPIK